MMDESSTVESSSIASSLASSLEEEEKVTDELEESHYDPDERGDAASNKCCIRIGGSVKGTFVPVAI